MIDVHIVFINSRVFVRLCAAHSHSVRVCTQCAERVQKATSQRVCGECACGKIPSVRCADICSNKKAQNTGNFETKTFECVLRCFIQTLQSND